MSYNEIKTTDDIQAFLDQTNALHDGYIIAIKYTNPGITKTGNTHYFHPEQTGLTLQILVTSIWDTVVEIEFEHLWAWQIKDNQWEMISAAVAFDSLNRIVWSDGVYDRMDEAKTGSYVIAQSMKWRIVT